MHQAVGVPNGSGIQKLFCISQHFRWFSAAEPVSGNLPMSWQASEVEPLSSPRITILVLAGC
jgi:hypothetical protein